MLLIIKRSRLLSQRGPKQIWRNNWMLDLPSHNSSTPLHSSLPRSPWTKRCPTTARHLITTQGSFSACRKTPKPKKQKACGILHSCSRHLHSSKSTPFLAQIVCLLLWGTYYDPYFAGAAVWRMWRRRTRWIQRQICADIQNTKLLHAFTLPKTHDFERQKSWIACAHVWLDAPPSWASQVTRGREQEHRKITSIRRPHPASGVKWNAMSFHDLLMSLWELMYFWSEIYCHFFSNTKHCFTWYSNFLTTTFNNVVYMFLKLS